MDAVIFDLDGTLIDTRRLYAAAYSKAFVDELGELPDFEAFAARRPSSERLFLVDWYGDVVGERIHQRMLAHYEAGAASELGGFFEGVGEMVEAIRARGISIAIVTGKSRFAYDVTCRHLDLSAFEVVVVEDDVPKAKPDPAGIERAIAALGASDVVYVGDTPMDIEAAHRAGARAAAVLWCWPAKRRLEVAGGLEERVWPLWKPSDLLVRLGL